MTENNVTKQNKELPLIPLYTYYILPYPVTQRHPLTLITFIILVNINTYIFMLTKRGYLIYYQEKHIWDMQMLFNKVAHRLLRGLHYTFLPAFPINHLSFYFYLVLIPHLFYSLVCFAHPLTIVYFLLSFTKWQHWFPVMKLVAPCFIAFDSGKQNWRETMSRDFCLTVITHGIPFHLFWTKIK